MRTIKILLAAGFLLMSGTSIYAQVQRNEAYLPKFAIKTNALYWATSTPNLGFEVGLAKKLTLDISGNYNPWKFGDDRQIKPLACSAGTALLALRTFQRKFLRSARTLRRNECQ